MTDTAFLTQANGFFTKGTLWLLSGDNAGTYKTVSSHYNNTLSFTALTSTIANGDRYAVTRPIYPHAQIVNAIMQALWETHIESEDHTLEGDGETLVFSLPSGVSNIKRVYTYDPDETTGESKSPSHHYRETHGEIKFDYGYAPDDGYLISIVYKDEHPDLTEPDDTLNTEIDEKWLRYKAAEMLLLWGLATYHGLVEYHIEDRMNVVLSRLSKLTARHDTPSFQITTAGVL